MKNTSASGFYLLFTIACVLISTISAAPTASQLQRDLPLYDTDYIKANFIKDRIPPIDSCIFYVGPYKQNAIELAASDCKGWTLYQSYYTANCFDDTVDPFKSYKAQNQVRDWFKVTSRAYAQVCTGVARIIFPTTQTIPSDSIWITDELDAILNGQTGITRIDQYDPNTGQTVTYPQQPPSPPAARSAAKAFQVPRQSISCLDEIQAIADSMPDVEGCEGC